MSHKGNQKQQTKGQKINPRQICWPKNRDFKTASAKKSRLRGTDNR